MWREEGPLGPGSLQRFVEADFERHYFTLYEEEGELWHDELRRLCAFDLLANSTDRKSGHCLLVPDGDGGGHIYAIDNGLSFHAEFKLRTVIWEFGGEDIPEHLVRDVERFVAAGVPDELAALLDPFERDALLARGRALVQRATVPHRRDGSPLSLASCLTPAIPISTNCCATVDRLCAARDWSTLLALYRAARASHERGRQHWPAAEYAAYRLALEAPGEFAAQVIVEGAGRFALGPLTEVAASTHTWDELATRISLRDRSPRSPRTSASSGART